ncbi:MAG TPA: class I adenylate-forming enzyme family protein [Actinomycetota bacterium]|nr:class I adenylate-forming enzyme family protein [Actinomycetota bacterium]
MIAQLLRRTATREPDTVAFVDGDRRLTYAEWDWLSDRAAFSLWAEGARPGDVIALVLQPSIAYPIAYLGAAKIGCVTAGINPRLAPPEIEHVLDDCDARMLVTDDERFADDPMSFTPERVLRPGSSPPEVERTEDDPVAIVYTSGTTGLPKGAVFASGALGAVRRIDAAVDTQARPVGIQAIPMAHVGFMTKIGSFIDRAATSVLLPRWSAREALEVVARERVTVLGGIPTQLTLMMHDAAFASTDRSSLRSIVLGGAPATSGLVREIREAFGAPVTVRYSCTELALCTATRSGDPEDVAAQTVGKPLPEVDLVIRHAGNDGVGEICARSPAMMTRYARGTPPFDEHGFFCTGDLGWVDHSGNLRITGRAKEMYIRGGYNVYPVEVEAALVSHPDITAAAVIGVPDEVLGEKGIAFVTARAGAQALDPDALKVFLRARLADYKVPDVIRFRTALPLTSMFKIDKRALRAELDPS